DRRSRSISSAATDSLSSVMPEGDAPEGLLNFRGLRLNFNVRHLARSGFGASINGSPLVSLSLLMCSHQNAVAVVPKSFGRSRSGTAGRLETSVRDPALGLRRRYRRRTAALARSAPVVPTALPGGRGPAKYCSSNARRAAATVGPIPT